MEFGFLPSSLADNVYVCALDFNIFLCVVMHYIKEKTPLICGVFAFVWACFVFNTGAPGAIRTPDLRLRRPALYPLSYRRVFVFANNYIIYHINGL